MAILGILHINHEVRFVAAFGLDRHESLRQRSAQALFRLHFDVKRNQVKMSRACANMCDAVSGESSKAIFEVKVRIIKLRRKFEANSTDVCSATGSQATENGRKVTGGEVELFVSSIVSAQHEVYGDILAHQPPTPASTVKSPSILAPRTSTSSVLSERTSRFPARTKVNPRVSSCAREYKCVCANAHLIALR